jgi:hypothetical protein
VGLPYSYKYLTYFIVICFISACILKTKQKMEKERKRRKANNTFCFHNIEFISHIRYDISRKFHRGAGKNWWEWNACCNLHIKYNKQLFCRMNAAFLVNMTDKPLIVKLNYRKQRLTLRFKVASVLGEYFQHVNVTLSTNMIYKLSLKPSEDYVKV